MKRALKATFAFLCYVVLFTPYIVVGLLYKGLSWAMYKSAKHVGYEDIN